MGSKNFPSTHPYDNNKDFPFFRQPQIIGSFSLDGERVFHNDRHQMMYLHQPGQHVSLDLNEGISKVIKPLESKSTENLDVMLRWILSHRHKFLTGNPSEPLQSLNTNIICFRGLLRLFLCTPYEQREPWIIQVIKWKGTIYIKQEQTQEDKERKARETEREKAFHSWGYKFEQYMSSSSPEEPPQTKVPVNENEEFCCMFRTRIGQLSCVYGAEMDGYKSLKKLNEDDPLSPGLFVELKTSRVVEYPGQERTLRKFKMQKWWAQSFLVGIEDIVCGWRNDNGIVHCVETIPVKKLPKLGAEYWQPNVCANFLSQFLSFLCQSITKDSLSTVYTITWNPAGGFSQTVEENQTTTFLPSWYTDNVFRD